MIYGIGTDILALARIEKLYHRYGETLAKRILNTQEWQDFLTSQDKARFLAKRFAAKEAFSKAVGTGIRNIVSFQNIALTHNHLGKPLLSYHSSLTTWLQQQGIAQVHISLSDEKKYIIAFAIAEQSMKNMMYSCTNEQ